MKLCREALAGAQVELQADGNGGYYCKHCGASEAGVRAALNAVRADWAAGGSGFRQEPRTFLGRILAVLIRRRGAHLPRKAMT